MERLRAAIGRQQVDRAPYALWRRFPAVDRSPAGLAQATLRFHERYGSDWLTLAPPPDQAVLAWGCVEAEEPGPDGTRPCARCAVRSPEDWTRIRPLDPGTAPGWQEQLEAIVRLGFDRRLGDAPVLIALPSPLAIAQRLAGARLAEDLWHHAARVESALGAITETLIRFAGLALDEGLAGVLYQVPRAGRAPGGDEIHARFGEPADRQVLGAIRPRATLIVVHAQGEPPALARLGGLPADVWSWAPAAGGPGLAAAQALVPGAVAGGLDPVTLRDGANDQAVAELRAALAETGGLGLVVGAGGPLLPDTPDGPVAAAVRALGGKLTPILGVVR